MSDAKSKCPMSFSVQSSNDSDVTASNTKQDSNDEQLNQNKTMNANLTFPFQRSSPFQPPEEYSRLRVEQPICDVTSINGDKICLISQYGDVCLVLGDEEHFKKSRKENDHGYLLNPNSSDYMIHRQIIEKEFSIERMKEFEAKMQSITDDLLTELIKENPPIDFVSQFAMKIPLLIISNILGINSIDHQFLFNRIHKNSNQTQIEHKELIDYLHRLIDNKKQTPQSDLISRLITEQFQPGKINQKQLIDILLIFLQDGNEFIKNQICLGLISLLQHHDQIDKLREDSSLIEPAIEEILRYHTVASFTTRRSTIKDITINGKSIPTGEHVLALNASANRDEQVFTNPDRFDVSRPPQHHLSFGYGIHQCVAIHFVRAHLKAVFTCIIQRLPNLQLAQSLDDIQFVTDSNKDIGVTKMLVKW